MKRFLLSLCLSALGATCVPGQPFTVTTVAPARFLRGVSPASAVTVTFSTPIDPATVNAARVKVYGRWSGPVPGSLSVNGATLSFVPGRPYFAGEQVFVSVASGVRSATNVPLTGGFASSFHARSLASSSVFPLDLTMSFRLPGEGLIRTYGFYAGDVDRDGSPDLSAANEVSYDIRLYKNNGCGAFGPATITPMPSGHEPSPNDGADFNGDGWLDFVTGNQNGQSIAMFLNDGAGNYLLPVTYPAGGQVHGLGVLDVDGDGDLDIVAANFNDLALLRNNGNGTFAPATYFSGGGTGEWGVAVADANGDGWTDIYCGNYLSSTVTILLNNGAGAFTLNTTINCGGNPWAMETGDLNADGVADVVVANNGQSNAGVLRGTAGGGLLAVQTYGVGSSPVWLDLGDLDGDGDLDVAVASFGGANATVFRNNGTAGLVSPFTLPSQQAASSVVIVDYDRDGDVDIIVTDELADIGSFYRQSGPSPAGVQPPSCNAALRVNSFAGRAGFGTAASQTIPGGSTAFVNVSGGASALYFLAAGSSAAPGLASPSGLINLVLAPLPIILVDGFGGNPAGMTNAQGESLLAFPIPPGSYGGTTLTLQALVQVPGGGATVTTNPETVIFP